MKVSKWDRQLHRWLAVVFTATLIIVSVGIAARGDELAAWVYLSPLLPLGLLLLTGMYLLVLPHLTRRRSRRATPRAG